MVSSGLIAADNGRCSDIGMPSNFPELVIIGSPGRHLQFHGSQNTPQHVMREMPIERSGGEERVRHLHRLAWNNTAIHTSNTSMWEASRASSQ